MTEEHPSRGFSLKDQLFNPHKVGWLADRFAQVVAGFDPILFTAECVSRFPELELKARADWMAEVLTRHLSPDFPTAAAQIVASLPPPLDPTRSDNDFGDFIFLPLGSFVAAQGQGHRLIALATLRELTKRFSMEYPIRGFITSDPDGMAKTLTEWAEDDNYHVRRLVSEGTRPMLPWASRLGLSHEWAMPLLDRLHADPTRFVTRSVANHLNDIAKSLPDLVVSRIGMWRDRDQQAKAELDWLARHALRTLVKKGHASALGALGFAHGTVVRARLRLPDQVVIGDVLEIVAEIESDTPADLVVDYAVHFIKANGQSSAKVFKLKTGAIRAGEVLVITKNHRLHAAATTYRLFPGQVRVDLLVNGLAAATDQFDLIAQG